MAKNSNISEASINSESIENRKVAENVSMAADMKTSGGINEAGI